MTKMCSVCIVRAQRDDDDFLPCSPACFWASLNAREQYARWDEREKAEIHNYHMPAYTAGFAAGLDAAQDAVAAISGHSTWPDMSYNDGLIDALAAIDALREKP